jgi:hypothetical protein
MIDSYHSSEVHGNEIRKLELECLQLAQIKSSLDNQLLIINEKTKILSYKVQHILDSVLPTRTILSVDNPSDDTDHLLTITLDSIEQVDSVINKNLHLFNGDADMWKKKADEQDIHLLKLKQDNHVLIKQCNDTQTLFNKTHDHLVTIDMNRMLSIGMLVVYRCIF